MDVDETVGETPEQICPDCEEKMSRCMCDGTCPDCGEELSEFGDCSCTLDQEEEEEEDK